MKRSREFLVWRIVLILAAILLLLIVPGCKRPNPAADVPEKVSVLGTVYPLADVARQIGGDSVDISWVLEDGQANEDVRVTPELHERLTRADLIIAAGSGEPWAVGGFDDPDRGPPDRAA